MADWDSATGNFDGTAYAGTFNAGELGSPGYSLDVDVLAPDLDETFDVLIKYGDEETYDVFRNGYERVGTTIFRDGTRRHFKHPRHARFQRG